MVSIVLKALHKARLGRHLQGPAPPSQLQLAPRLQRLPTRPQGRRLEVAEQLHTCGGTGVSSDDSGGHGTRARRAVGDLQADVSVKFSGHAVDHILHAKRRRHPARQPLPPALHRAVVGIGAVQGHVHHQPWGRVLHQGQPPGQRQRSGVAGPVQRFLGGWKGQHIKAQGLEIGALQRFDVGDGGHQCALAGRAHRILVEAPLAHVLQVGGQRIAGELQDQRHPLQPGPGGLQLQRTHVGLELSAVDALRAFKVAFDAAQHHLVGRHAVLEVVGDLVGRHLKVLLALGPRVLLFALPVQKGQAQGQQCNQRGQHHGQPAVVAGASHPVGRPRHRPLRCRRIGVRSGFWCHGILGGGGASAVHRLWTRGLQHYQHLSCAEKGHLRANCTLLAHAARLCSQPLCGSPVPAHQRSPINAATLNPKAWHGIA